MFDGEIFKFKLRPLIISRYILENSLLKDNGLLKLNNNTIILPTKSPVFPWHPIMRKPYPVIFVWLPC